MKPAAPLGGTVPLVARVAKMQHEPEDTITDDTMPFLDALLKRRGGDFVKELAEEVLQRLMVYDVEGGGGGTARPAGGAPAAHGRTLSWI